MGEMSRGGDAETAACSAALGCTEVQWSHSTQVGQLAPVLEIWGLRSLAKADSIRPMTKPVLVHQSRRSMLSLMSASVLVTGLGSSGCFGGFALTKKLYAFNSGISGKWVRWLVFLLFYCFGVYFVTAVIDGLVLNSVEFWTGKQPLSSTQVHEGKDAKALVSAPDQDTVVIEMHRGKAKVGRVALTRLEGAIMLESSNGHRYYVRDRQDTVEDTEIVDAQGQTLAQLGAREWDQVKIGMQQGQGPAEALAQVWMTPGPAKL